MSNAAQAYARTSQNTSSPREIEAQALLKAARQLQEVQTNWAGPGQAMENALLFNRRLWSIFMSAAQADENQQSIEVRQNIANIGVFVMKQTVDMQLNPDPAKLKPLIDINCNLAAGLCGPRLRQNGSHSHGRHDEHHCGQLQDGRDDDPDQDALCGGRSGSLRGQLERKIRRPEDVQDHGLERRRLPRQGAIPERAAPANFRKC